MYCRSNILVVLLLLTSGLSLAQAQQADAGSRHHFGVQVPIWFKGRASFSARPAANPGPDNNNPFTDRFYDDGYNRLDSTGNAVSPPLPFNYSFNRTAFFGYQSDAQVNNNPGAVPGVDPIGGSLALHSVAINGGEYTDGFAHRPNSGIELFYRYDLVDRERWTVSLEAGFSYQHLDWRQIGQTSATVGLLTDTYALGGVFLPVGAAPYDGPFLNNVPAIPVIGSTPARTEATVPAQVGGRRQLDMHSFMLRLGPAIDRKFGDRWMVGALAGAAAGWSKTRLKYEDSIVVADPTVPQINQSGGSSDSRVWLGLYTALRVNYELSEKWAIHGEFRRIWQNSFMHDGGVRSATVDMSKGSSLVLGVSYRFR
jgi:hypothetical protein